MKRISKRQRALGELSDRFVCTPLDDSKILEFTTKELESLKRLFFKELRENLENEGSKWNGVYIYDNLRQLYKVLNMRKQGSKVYRFYPEHDRWFEVK